MTVLRSLLLVVGGAVLSGAQSDKIHQGTPEWDTSGYLTFVPTGGVGIGKQLDFLLHAMWLSKQLDRTLILPHLFDKGFSDPNFGTYPSAGMFFDVEAMQAETGLRVVPWASFLHHVADEWPKKMRHMYCAKATAEECAELQMFGAKRKKSYFESIRVGKLKKTHLSESHDVAELKKLSPDEHSVLILMNGLASPPPAEAVSMQKGLVWNDKIKRKAKINVLARSGIRNETVFVGVHMRIADDMKETCANGFEAAFANGAKGEGFHSASNCAKEGFTPPKEACYHDHDTVRSQVQEAINHAGSCHLFVSSDSPLAGKDDVGGVFEFLASPRDVKPPQGAECKRVRLFSARSRSVRNLYKEADPMVDQYILSKATHFVGNCASSFSAAVVRQREHLGKGKETSLFTVPYEYVPKVLNAHSHDEL